eukprot:2872190-Pyramimonas_sp.AAC.1
MADQSDAGSHALAPCRTTRFCGAHHDVGKGGAVGEVLIVGGKLFIQLSPLVGVGGDPARTCSSLPRARMTWVKAARSTRCS